MNDNEMGFDLDEAALGLVGPALKQIQAVADAKTYDQYVCALIPVVWAAHEGDDVIAIEREVTEVAHRLLEVRRVKFGLGSVSDDVRAALAALVNAAKSDTVKQ